MADAKHYERKQMIYKRGVNEEWKMRYQFFYILLLIRNRISVSWKDILWAVYVFHNKI